MMFFVQSALMIAGSTSYLPVATSDQSENCNAEKNHGVHQLPLHCFGSQLLSGFKLTRSTHCLWKRIFTLEQSYMLYRFSSVTLFLQNPTDQNRAKKSNHFSSSLNGELSFPRFRAVFFFCGIGNKPIRFLFLSNF